MKQFWNHNKDKINEYLAKNPKGNERADKEIYGDIKVRFLREHDELGLFNKIVIICLVASFTIAILVSILSSKKEVIFTTFVVIFGLIFMIIITPMSPPDEQKHYEYSYQVSIVKKFTENLNLIKLNLF